ncbi:cysteine desulfurase-like protein [Gordonia sp. HNM0687]|uniref:Cysteine desulfurase-like protein n=1 Tax=Gordonia mangrovi TaxID=2665643 RepID=A0A6L7GSI3_9ACTN|nr:cysteine desulfurase-like protein [Gordonia mangrovi]MXP21605.1 cysteine desulfurase-like protein [Gordonia mangrovi]UVF80347.1 cysteine desulfurase-like protein [Gordonia mangrovi]
MPFDVAHVRGLFPSLGDGWIHLDPQAGMLIPDSVASAVSTGFRQLSSAPGGEHPGARAAADAAERARRAVADLVAADPAGVVLGPSRSALVAGLAEALPASTWFGANVVVSRQDDEPNIVPWIRAADTHGAQIRWAEIDVETGALPTWQYRELIDQRTAVVAVTLASSTMGAITDVSAIAASARQVGARLVVDATSAAPYMPLDMAELGADVMLVSAERWGGPRVAAMVFRDPSAMASLRTLAMNPRAEGPARLEPEPLQGGLLAGLTASVEHLAALDDESAGTRRHRLVTALGGVSEYTRRLTLYLMTTVQHLNQVNLIGTAADRVPAVSFTFDGVAAEKVVRRLADNGICALADVPSRALVRMGADDFGGAVTVGLGPYSTPYEVDHLVRTLGSLG